MNTAIVASGSPAFDDGQFAGIGLAVPMTMIEPAVTQIIATGRVRKGFMGITVTDLNGSVRQWLRMRGFHRFGLLVHHIDEGHPARDAGLREGDVIEWIGPTRIMTTSQLQIPIPSGDGGDDVEVKVWRFDPATSTGTPETLRLHRIVAQGLDGVGVLQLNEMLKGAAAPAGRDHAGVLVATVDPTGPAYAAGLIPGDLITTVAGVSVDSITQLQSRISSIQPGENVALTIQRPGLGGGRVQDIVLTVALTSLESLRLVGDLDDEHPVALPHLGIAKMRDAGGRGQDTAPGVEVVELVEGSQLAEAIEPGSVIIRCGAVPVRSISDLIRALGQIPRTGRAPIRVLLPDGTTIDHHLYVQ
jgi:S1-C subfamily serine protease